MSEKQLSINVKSSRTGTSSTACVDAASRKEKFRNPNPFKRPKDSELPVLLTQEKVERRNNLIHRMKQPLHKKTARESKADAFDVLKSIPDFCHSKELPPTPTTVVQKDPEVAQAMAKGEKLKNLETVKDFVRAKREIFLIQYLIGVKKDELLRIQNLQLSEERKLDKAEARLEEDAVNFDRFLKSIDRDTINALKQVEIETKMKLDKVAEIRKLNVQIVTLRSKIRKLEEVLMEYKSYEKFLTNVAPPEWKEKRTKDRQIVVTKHTRLVDRPLEFSALDIKHRPRSMSILSIKGKRMKRRLSKKIDVRDLSEDLDHHSSDSESFGIPQSDHLSSYGNYDEEDEKVDIYFTKPQQLLDIFAGMEEKSLLMIQKSQDNEEALEELQTAFALTKKKLGKEIGVIKKQTQMLERLVKWEDEKARDFELMVKLFSFGQYSEDLQDKLLSDLNAKVEAVYTNVIGPNDANINTLQMTIAIENKLEELLQNIDDLPTNVVEAAEKQRERHRRQIQRELKLKLQEEMQAERQRRTMEKALSATKLVTGRKLVYRSIPPVVKQKVEKTQWHVREDEEMLYFFN